jgi:cytochrome c oxidase cbb3-type subunit III
VSETGSGMGSSRAPARRRRGLGVRFWGALAVLLLVIAGGAYYWVGQSGKRALLMRADPDAILEDAELTRFALGHAQPVYDRQCASCHGGQMQGDPRRGVPALTGKKWLYGEGRVAQIEHTILHGIRSGDPKGWNLADMPGFAQKEPYRRYRIEPLEPAEIRDVIEFLLVTGGKAGDKAAAERGQKIYADKGQCFDCHSADVQGDSAIGAPNLIDGMWLYGAGTREDIYDTVARGRAGICPPWIQTLDQLTIRSLAVLIYTASHKPGPKSAATSPAPVAGAKG